MNGPHCLPLAPGRTQRGASLLFALLTLVALLLATLALVRSMDTGALVLGNIGFKQDATAAADQAARQAITWLTTHNASLNTDDAANGYYASTQELAADGTARPPLDATGNQRPGTNLRQLIDWDGDRCASTPAETFNACALLSKDAGPINGNAARYAIFRLCDKPGNHANDSSISCARPVSSSSGSAIKRGEMNYIDTTRLTGATGPYYRIVVRIQGARNTTSFTETLVHF